MGITVSHRSIARSAEKAAVTIIGLVMTNWDEDLVRTEMCDECGWPVHSVWYAPDDIWERVTSIEGGGGGCYCIRCFDRMGKKKGALLFWECAEEKYPTLFKDGNTPKKG
jgi:hypothetical protein